MRLKNFFVAVLLFAGVSVQAQQMAPIPQDKDVRVGKLDNGLTYYIRHNNYPEHVANFYIAQKVGSINENEDQRGLAHLLEHMAFNGSEHFKDNLLQEYLQSIGVEYGRNLNAYTSTDQTVYFITDVPTARITAIDSCMLVLKDWSNGITLDAKAIDQERDVVHNEYRMRIVGTQKILESVLPDLYPGSKYGQRFPIGLMSVIDGCSPETLRAYYRKWYRPDNQGIIIVGDVDVDRTEQKIKELFGGIKVPANAAKVELEPVPDNNEGIYVVGKDKEQQVSLFLISMKHDATPDSLKSNLSYMVFDYARNLISLMIGARFAEEVKKPESPFLQVRAEVGQYLVSRTKDALTLTVVPKEGQELAGLSAGIRELKRVKDFGFTATEYARGKSEYLSRLEKVYNNREKHPNDAYCQQYVKNFIENEPIPSIEDEYQIMNALSANIPVEIINQIAGQLIADNDTNFVVLAAVQEKDGKQYFTGADMKKAVDAVRQEKLTAYVDNVKQEPLITEMPAKGSIVKSTENAALGFKQLTLSNGATVLMKKTDFNADEIVFRATSNGGASVFGKEDVYNLQFANYILSQSGLGNFSSTDLQKALAGKQVGTQFSVDNSKHGLSGNSTPKDLETLFQLIYLDFTKVTKDEKAVNNFLTLISTQLKNISLNNEAVFEDSVMSVVYNNNPYFRIPSAENIEGISYDRVLEIWKNLYGNAADFTFTFVGNYDEAQLCQFIEQYIASLPSKGKATLTQKEIRTFANGEKNRSFEKKMENPQAQANSIWRSNPVKFTLQNSVLQDVSGRMLDMMLNREIRERLSAAYHAGAESELDVDGPATYISIKGTGKLNPDKAAEAIPEFQKGMKSLVAAPNADDLLKVKQILLKQADVDAKTNRYWTGVLNTWKRFGVDVYTDYKKTVEAVSTKSVSDFLKNVVLKSKNHVEVIMMPEK